MALPLSVPQAQGLKGHTVLHYQPRGHTRCISVSRPMSICSQPLSQVPRPRQLSWRAMLAASPAAAQAHKSPLSSRRDLLAASASAAQTPKSAPQSSRRDKLAASASSVSAAAPAADVIASPAESASPAAESTDPSLTVLLYKHDLRMSDHPGLVATSASSSRLLPLFVFDPTVLRSIPLHLLAPLLAALSSLRAALQERGSNLAIRIGSTPTVVLQEADKSGLTLREVLVEEEVESTWQDVIGALEEALGTTEDVAAPEAASSAADVTRWRTPLFESYQVPGNAQHSAFLESCAGALAPLEAPRKLPPFPSNIDPGDIPSLAQILQLRGGSLHRIEPATSPPPPPASPSAASASTATPEAASAPSPASAPSGASAGAEGPATATAADSLRHEAQALLHDWACLSHDPVVDLAAWSAVAGGEASAQTVLQEYIFGTQQGGPSRGVLRAAVEAEETCPYASLLSIFGPALSLGTLSHRQVHASGLLALGMPPVYPRPTQQPPSDSNPPAPSSGAPDPSSGGALGSHILDSGRPEVTPGTPPAYIPKPPLSQALFPDPFKRAPLAAVKHALAFEWHHLLAAHSQGRGDLPLDPPLPQNGAGSSGSSATTGTGTSSSSTGTSASSTSTSSSDALVQPETFFTSTETGGVPPPLGVLVRHWRWRGMLVEYAVADLTGHSDGESDTVIEYSDKETEYSDRDSASDSTQAQGSWLGALSQVFGGKERRGPQGVEASKGGTTGSSQGGEPESILDRAHAEEEKPPVLLVHGFGAFWQHYRDVMLPLAYRGHRVYALTLPGFGRSEKPAAAYSQYLWSHCAADFIADVIGAPAVVAGNSIGGYTVASLAADHPQLARSVVLFNSAGKIDTEQTLDQGRTGGGTSGAGVTGAVEGGEGGAVAPEEGEREGKEQRARLRHTRRYAASLVKEKRSSGAPRAVVWAVSRGLLAYLQSSTPTVIKRCYPNSPDRADGKLVREILRAATDPGSVEVVESVFFLPKPRPLNLLLDVFGGPVLVLQGRNDPLNDAVARANAIRSACPQVSVHFLKAGHCPHDEVPDAVTSVLVKWAVNPWRGSGAPGGEEEGAGVTGTALGEEGPLEVLVEEAMLGAGLRSKQGAPK